MVDPLVAHDIVNGRSLRRVVVQNLRDQVTSAVGDCHVLREVVGVHSDSLVRRLHIRCLKRRLSNDKCVDNDANRPDIDLVRVTLLALQHFGCDIVRGTANGTLALTVKLEFCRQTEITDLHLHFVVKEKVTELQISVDDAMTVEVLDGRTDLIDVALDLELV